MRYFLYWPLWLAVIILRYPLSFIAVAVFSKEGKLSFPFSWLGTIDNGYLVYN